jgi:hypothetical protein
MAFAARPDRGAFLDADYSVEMGAEDAVLEVPWAAPDACLRYYNLREHPEMLEQIEEARRFPELAEFLKDINGPGSAFESVKCDVWASTEMEEAEEIYGASLKCGSYCDVVFRDENKRVSFAAHEALIRRLVELLKKAPEIPATVEFVVRRCVFRGDGAACDGCAISCFIFGYGKDEEQARRQWGIALRLVKNALRQATPSACRKAI